ncbi:hypothetical protein GGP41_009579 [Bipolaris sorokiniana]|uniref:Uncharacterized protein n=1 Tax=Cochliobolus sativus TaxID=45130 RepID=A0A8H5Z954_COCSA|nr:hypothetical protein GGP41_009579 [Bipolaris sorokiniana]
MSALGKAADPSMCWKGFQKACIAADQVKEQPLWVYGSQQSLSDGAHGAGQALARVAFTDRKPTPSGGQEKTYPGIVSSRQCLT